MSATTAASAERSYRDLGTDVRRLEREHEEAREAADRLVERMNADGKDPVHDPSAFEEVDRAYAAAEKIGDELKRARGERDRLGERVGDNNRARRRPGGGEWADALVERFGDTTRPEAALPSSGTLTVPGLTSGIVTLPDRPRRLFEAVPFDPNDTGSWAYLAETARTHAAAGVPKGGRKPESTYTLEKRTQELVTIAHLTQPVDRTDIEDVELAGTYLEQALRVGVELELDRQILAGAGAASDELPGIINAVGITLIPFESEVVTTARRAVAALEGNDIEPLDSAVFVLSIDDWADLELIKDSTGNFVVDDERQPIDVARRRLWGVRVIPTSVATDGTAHLVDVLDSTSGRERRAGVRVDFSENVWRADLFGAGLDGSLFEANQLQFRGENRYGFDVTRPRGVVQFPTTGA